MTNIRRHPHPTVKVTDLLTSLEKIRGGFLKNFKTFNDLPESEDLRFDFSRYGWDLANYLTSDVLPTPLTIGLNGEWGSGKTTMIKAVQKNIDEINAENGGGVVTRIDSRSRVGWPCCMRRGSGCQDERLSFLDTTDQGVRRIPEQNHRVSIGIRPMRGATGYAAAS